MNHKTFYFFTLLLTIRSVCAYRFMRSIEAVGYPFYKILLSLGTCKDRLIFEDNTIWGSVRLNRIFDIYYQSVDDTTLISRVEIKLVVNNTDCTSTSSTGVGKTKFSAILVMSTNIGLLFYNLNIFTCSPLKNRDRKLFDENTDVTSQSDLK